MLEASIPLFMRASAIAAPGLAARRAYEASRATIRSSSARLGAAHSRRVSRAYSSVPQSLSMRSSSMGSFSASLPLVKSATVPNSRSPRVRSGYVAAKSIAIGPPSEVPNTTPRSESAASITGRRSSIRVSRLGSCDSGTRSDSPTPRLSNRIRRDDEASRLRKRANDGSSQSASMLLVQGRTMRRSIGPSPCTW